MGLDFQFFFNSILLGIGLAMDAFSVSLANGLNEPKMPTQKMCGVAGVFSFFQYLMPMLGWICVHTIAEKFKAFEKCIPFIALILLLFIGGKMVLEGMRVKQDGEEQSAVGIGGLMIQGVATSIDALSVGFTIAEYDLTKALICGAVIAAVTFLICVTGVALGKRFGTGLSDKASVLGGAILIFIGIEIFISGII